jgi:hypothetical protein
VTGHPASANATRRPSCISRGLFALKIRPKLGLPKMRFGRSKLAWLRRLKISHRNSTLPDAAKR